jgi:hypothetical protein
MAKRDKPEIYCLDVDDLLSKLYGSGGGICRLKPLRPASAVWVSAKELKDSTERLLEVRRKTAA